MAVDVAVETVIQRPVAEVASYAGDPGNAPSWYVNIDSAERRTAGLVALGSRVDFVATFLGRRIAYTYEVTEFVPGERLVMQTAEGPFPMRTTYVWEPAGVGTRMTLRNTGEPSGFSRLAGPVVQAAMRRAMTKDLAALKRILEGEDPTPR
jgi:uncharacterized protein YndB with AHSA1/START domain